MANLNLSAVTSRNDAPIPRRPPFYKEFYLSAAFLKKKIVCLPTFYWEKLFVCHHFKEQIIVCLPAFYQEKKPFFVFYQYFCQSASFLQRKKIVRFSSIFLLVICWQEIQKSNLTYGWFVQTFPVFFWSFVLLGVFVFGCISFCFCIWVYFYLPGRNYTSPNPAGLRREIDRELPLVDCNIIINYYFMYF